MVCGHSKTQCHDVKWTRTMKMDWVPHFPAHCWSGWNWVPHFPAHCWSGWNWVPLFPAHCWGEWNWVPLLPAHSWNSVPISMKRFMGWIKILLLSHTPSLSLPPSLPPSSLPLSLPPSPPLSYSLWSQTGTASNN